MYADEEATPIVLDNGSETIKLGFAGDDEPRTTIPTVYSSRKLSRMRWKEDDSCEYYEYTEALTGKSALSKYKKSQYPPEILRYPVEHGLFFHSMDQMEEIWQNGFAEIRAEVTESPVLVAEPVETPHVQRERLTEVMFETFGVPSLCLECQNFLSLYYTGRSSGVVLECGDGVTSALSIIDGCSDWRSAVKSDMGGRDIVDHLARTIGAPPSPLLHPTKQHTFPPVASREVIRKVMEKHCYVSKNFQEELGMATEAGPKKQYGQTPVKSDFEMPDGQTISVGHERFCAPECLFKPPLLGNGFESGVDLGVHEIAFRSLFKCDPDEWQTLSRNIFVSGGCSLFEGFVERMRDEVDVLCRAENVAFIREVYRVTDPLIAAWGGGSILASMSRFGSMCVTKGQYDEKGLQIVMGRSS